MNDEELKSAMQKVNDELKSLPQNYKSLSRKQRQQRGTLLSQQKVLAKIKTAKEKCSIGDETYYSVLYSVLSSPIGRYPILANFIVDKLRWNIH